MNPVQLIRGGIIFPIEKLGLIDLPFSFILPDNKNFLVDLGEQPIYFARKRMKVSGKSIIKSQYIHRYCVGVTRKDGTQIKNWIYPDGTFDTTGDNPSS